MATANPTPLRVAVLLSGSGTTLENLFARREAGQLPIDIVCVVSSRADAFGIERAKQRGVPTVLVERKKHKDAEAFSNLIFDAIRPYKPKLVCLAGFMSLLRIPKDFEGRLMNIHPALLPAFGGKGCYGHHVHEAVLEHGCKLTGCTAHFVDHQYDHGPIILQKAVEVREDDTPDTLAERVQATEREVFPEAIRLFAAGRLKLEGHRVRILSG
jgi:formyltetrahydrofolate-dependent phosphoribosylglycinamide formyltransferase